MRCISYLYEVKNHHNPLLEVARLQVKFKRVVIVVVAHLLLLASAEAFTSFIDTFHRDFYCMNYSCACLQWLKEPVYGSQVPTFHISPSHKVTHFFLLVWGWKLYYCAT
jgi:hypothetical protein